MASFKTSFAFFASALILSACGSGGPAPSNSSVGRIPTRSPISSTPQNEETDEIELETLSGFDYWLSNEPQGGGRKLSVDFMKRHANVFAPENFRLPDDLDAIYRGNFQGLWTHAGRTGSVRTDVRVEATINEWSNRISGTIGTQGISIDGHNFGSITFSGDISNRGQFDIEGSGLRNVYVVGGFSNDVSMVAGEVKSVGFYSPINWDDQRSIDNFTNRQDNSLVGAFVAEKSN